jgi:hypothetical protein
VAEEIPWANTDIVTAFDEEGWSTGVGHLVGIRPLAARFLDLGTSDPLGLNKSIDLDGKGVDSAASSRTGAATAEIRRQSPPINEEPQFRAKSKSRNI